jgi:hypothetical protein
VHAPLLQQSVAREAFLHKPVWKGNVEPVGEEVELNLALG